MLHLFRIALAMLLLGSLSACMKPSDLADGADYYLRDAGGLDHSASQRSNNRRIQADSFIYIGQGPFVPPGYRYARPNVVAEQAFEGFVEYFPLVRRAKAPLGLDDAMREARAAGAHYLLYCRFARGDNRIGNWEEWEDEEELGRVGRDRSVIQVMLIETSTRFLVDSATIRSRGGFLTFYDATPEDLLRPPLEQYAQELLGLNSRGTGYE
ncbi:DUF4823 domain-containing protein [Pseudomonas aeruginosa]|uniref:DUF4823 domain-containing protein n=1 Tax=Pseudomonas aeruginosa TaxID=287 RepID=UPI000FC40143|nr:DUF4823 domain-containing protein [Pseudomonas aeruginosa]MCS8072475.1 DUF4823 domain-containing protein [Pseudomonas aeruginosa]MCS9226314.1 DUF4823 domain-containing protein [Pseudomonas aeruginosa]MCS9721034.1 DUF4823 domain-containing protein [Pseudomonas aeruginosa]MCT0428569.1 DUF4823 domain-containing protein [Pseudomonas aeruginosa]MCT0613038.1 DUF4823 domain-containing protein [Pseudomonas aeruginosa]